MLPGVIGGLLSEPDINIPADPAVPGIEITEVGVVCSLHCGVYSSLAPAGDAAVPCKQDGGGDAAGRHRCRHHERRQARGERQHLSAVLQ